MIEDPVEEVVDRYRQKMAVAARQAVEDLRQLHRRGLLSDREYALFAGQFRPAASWPKPPVSDNP